MTKDYGAMIDARVAKYGRFLGGDNVQQGLFFNDVIEASEDFPRLSGIVQALADGTLPEAEFYDACLKLSAWSWHLSDHLGSLSKFLHDCDFHSGEFDSDDEEV